MRRAKALESDIQIAVIDWLTLKKIPHYHIPNGGKRGVLEAIRFKRMGVSAGVPDICIPLSTLYYHSMYIEIKRNAKANTTDSQCNWHKILTDNKMKVIVDWDFDRIIKEIEAYIHMHNNEDYYKKMINGGE